MSADELKQNMNEQELNFEKSTNNRTVTRSNYSWTLQIMAMITTLGSDQYLSGHSLWYGTSGYF